MWLRRRVVELVVLRRRSLSAGAASVELFDLALDCVAGDAGGVDAAKLEGDGWRWVVDTDACEGVPDGEDLIGRETESFVLLV